MVTEVIVISVELFCRLFFQTKDSRLESRRVLFDTLAVDAAGSHNIWDGSSWKSLIWGYQQQTGNGSLQILCFRFQCVDVITELCIKWGKRIIVCIRSVLAGSSSAATAITFTALNRGYMLSIGQ